MGLDMAKYRRIFLEEATDHLGEIGHALLDLEKEMGNVAAIDTIFRMAHSIKSMAASLGYEPVSDLAHRMEDRMEGLRADGRVRNHEELALLFRGLEALEAMVADVSEDRPLAPVDPALLAGLADDPHAPEEQKVSDDPHAPEELGGSDDPHADGPAVTAEPDRVGGEPKKVRS